MMSVRDSTDKVSSDGGSTYINDQSYLVLPGATCTDEVWKEYFRLKEHGQEKDDTQGKQASELMKNQGNTKGDNNSKDITQMQLKISTRDTSARTLDVGSLASDTATKSVLWCRRLAKGKVLVTGSD